MKNFILLIQFFTRIPLKNKVEYEEISYGKITYLLPLIGLIIGIGAFGINYILDIFKLPIYINSLILLIYFIVITGGLHLDGLADSCDGIFSYRSRERILEIMKDPHIGTNGVIALVVALLSKFVLYSYGGIKAIALSFIVGRLAIILSASLGEYARDKGMAIAIIKYNELKSFVKSLVVELLIFSFFKEYIIYLGISLVFAYIIHRQISKKLGGITGDTLGFLCEITEIFFLFVVILGGSLWTF